MCIKKSKDKIPMRAVVATAGLHEYYVLEDAYEVSVNSKLCNSHKGKFEM